MKTLILRKAEHVYVFRYTEGDEIYVLSRMLDFSEDEACNLEPAEVENIVNKLGYRIENPV